MQSRPVTFVGRKSELRAARKAIVSGKHVFLRGPYGIGKSTFGRALLASLGGPWLEVSLEQGISEMAASIVRVLSHYNPDSLPIRSVAGSVYFHDLKSRIKSFKTLKRLMERLCVYQFPILIDDFTMLSTSKLAFLHMLHKMGFRMIVAVDSRYDEKGMASLERFCPNHVWIDLPRLSIEESRELVRSLLKDQVLGAEQIEFWARTYRGHPLQIVERIRGTVGPGGSIKRSA